MNFIKRFVHRDESNEREEPLCQAPKGGEEIQFDQEEQAAIDAALRENARSDEEFGQILTDAGLDPDDYDLSSLEPGEHILACRRSLKRLAYERYTNGEYVLAAETSIKALGVTSNYNGVFRHDGVAELWLMLAHIHACTGRFKIAKNLITQAKNAAKKDSILTGDLRAFWNRGIRALEADLRIRRRPLPTRTVFFVPGDEDGPIVPRL
jgi:hypothetical protein